MISERKLRGRYPLVYLSCMSKDADQNIGVELRDIREILGVIVKNMVTKDEFSEFKDEMYAFKNEMYTFKDEMYDFKKEMYAFKDEVREFQEETRQNFRDLRDDIRDLQQEDPEFDDLLGRVKYVERKLGIESGK